MAPAPCRAGCPPYANDELRKLPPGQQAVVWQPGPGYIGLDTYDVLRQHVVSHHFWFDESKQARLFRSPHRYIWLAELDLMAQLAGFELETRHADWLGTEFTAESRSRVSVYRIPRPPWLGVGPRAPPAVALR